MCLSNFPKYMIKCYTSFVFYELSQSHIVVLKCVVLKECKNVTQNVATRSGSPVTITTTS
jgi:hypothetical protein